MYLDDDNMLASPVAVREMMSAIETEDDMILWVSKLGRRTPSPKNFGKTQVVRGDIDASGFQPATKIKFSKESLLGTIANFFLL